MGWSMELVSESGVRTRKGREVVTANNWVQERMGGYRKGNVGFALWRIHAAATTKGDPYQHSSLNSVATL